MEGNLHIKEGVKCQVPILNSQNPVFGGYRKFLRIFSLAKINLKLLVSETSTKYVSFLAEEPPMNKAWVSLNHVTQCFLNFIGRSGPLVTVFLKALTNSVVFSAPSPPKSK